MLHLIRKPRRRGSKEAKNLIKECEDRIARESLVRVEQVAKAVSNLNKGWEDEIESHLAFVVEANTYRNLLNSERTKPQQLELSAEQDQSVLRYQASTLFLRECWEFLTKDPEQNERLHLVTGTITKDGVRVLSRMEKVKLEKQSAAYVKANANDTHKKIVSLTEKDGHLLLAMFHSHIMKGAASTKPSGTDIANQERFVKIGCEAIGGIFSLDGFVRFFSTCKDIEFDVYGNGAELVVDEPRTKVFKLPVGK